MGMPISSYTVLKALSDGLHGEELERAMRALRPFSLFAFVIHDPETHPDLDRVLREEYDKLDHYTGEHLLFFCLTRPQEDWIEHARGREYYDYFVSRHPGNNGAAELHDPNNAPVSNDPQITAFSFATALGIPLEDLPCIAITSDLRRRTFKCVRTSPEDLAGHLEDLGFIASRRPAAFYDANFTDSLTRHHEVIEDYDLPLQHSQRELTCSLAGALSSVLSFVEASWTGGDARARDAARGHACSTIRELDRQIRELKGQADREPDGELDEKLDSLCVSIVSFLALITRDDAEDSMATGLRGYIEHESFLILRTAEKVARLFGAPNATERMLGAIEWDYTPVVICYTKTLEIETNLSYVHWARQELGIELPRYFKRFQPHKEARVNISEREYVDLNIEGPGDSWKGPGLGRSRLACRNLAQKNGTGAPKLDRVQWNRLLNHWENVANIRNNAAHTGIAGESKQKAIILAFRDLLEMGAFSTFKALKNQYRGQP